MGGLVALAILLILYFLPTIIAHERGVTSLGSIFVINLFLGWTLIGWVVALAMGVRTVPFPEGARARGSSATATRLCPNCKGAMGRAASVCRHCGGTSTAWVYHAGVWWTKGSSDEWQWIDEKTWAWHWYKDGTPSEGIDRTPNLLIDPAVISPPDAPKLELAAASSERQRADSFAGELERLADLHARGALNDDQFEAAKSHLLRL